MRITLFIAVMIFAAVVFSLLLAVPVSALSNHVNPANPTTQSVNQKPQSRDNSPEFKGNRPLLNGSEKSPLKTSIGVKFLLPGGAEHEGRYNIFSVQEDGTYEHVLLTDLAVHFQIPVHLNRRNWLVFLPLEGTWAPFAREIIPTDASGTINLELWKGKAVHGRVVDSQGRPIFMARVRGSYNLDMPDFGLVLGPVSSGVRVTKKGNKVQTYPTGGFSFSPSKGYTTRTTFTDELGNFKIEGLPFGPTKLTVSFEHLSKTVWSTNSEPMTIVLE